MVPRERNTLTYEFSTGPVRSLVVAYKKTSACSKGARCQLQYNRYAEMFQPACMLFLSSPSVDFCDFLHKLKPVIRSLYTDYTDEVVLD